MTAIFMGIILRWNDVDTPYKKEKTGKMWHAYSLILRLAILVLFIPALTDYNIITIAYILSIYIWVIWVLYDAACNLIRPFWAIKGSLINRIFYSGSVDSGTTSIIDRTFGDILPWAKMIYTVLVAVFTVFTLTL
jgi:hypothetical protein